MAIQNDILAPGASLTPGQSLLSPNGLYRLVFQKTGNLYVFLERGVSQGGMGIGFWSNSYNFTATALTMSLDGTLSTTVSSGSNSSYGSTPGSYLRILDTGEAVLFQSAWNRGPDFSNGWGGNINTFWSGSILDSSTSVVFKSPNGLHVVQFNANGYLCLDQVPIEEESCENPIAILQGDNNFVVYPGDADENGDGVWDSGTNNSGGWDTHLALSDSGQLILYVRNKAIVPNPSL